MSETDFEKHILTGIDDYVLQARQCIPGRDALFLMARCYFENKLTKDAKILVVGAGGGEEIVSLGKYNPSWSFVGVDLSEKMLKLAHIRIQQEDLKNDVQLHRKEVFNLEERDFDAATCFLTLHFVPDDGSKLKILQTIKTKLKPNSPFILVDAAAMKETAEFRDDVLAWKRHAQNNGMPPEHLDKLVENTMNVPFVTEDRELELLASSGFKQIKKMYQGTWIHGWLSQ
ncbi:Methyltransferase type 12 [Hyella patelloides LEGE 07179]|uniref:Methyltransferase type 12 n=1 Tax=Hyella patelloides LEGE 07179 TaxID=945734 RepID=A0A563VPQ0_9CYAN|nr:class I SAM-dependent methyltransferase [Hyella patelloides]VEP13380.1 Methyltransferase type 12 [Hyella patelloides LEGE 07179]